MKIIGFVLIAFGIALILYVAHSFFTSRDTIISPIPEREGVKVIYVTPGS